LAHAALLLHLLFPAAIPGLGSSPNFLDWRCAGAFRPSRPASSAEARARSGVIGAQRTFVAAGVFRARTRVDTERRCATSPCVAPIEAPLPRALSCVPRGDVERGPRYLSILAFFAFRDAPYAVDSDRLAEILIHLGELT